MENAHKDVWPYSILIHRWGVGIILRVFHEEGGKSVHRWRRSWLTLSVCLWIIFAGGAAAFACVSHPATDNGAHPLLCMDSRNAVMPDDHGSTLLAEGRRLRSPSKMHMSTVHPAALGLHCASILDAPAHRLSWPQAGIPSSAPASCQPVLRL